MQYKILLSVLLLASLHLNGQVIFPGDLNNDGKANHIDLLPLSIAYGVTGPPRFEPSLEWIPQETEMWGLNLPVSDVNMSFVDADGNGIIDSLDLDGIILNYDSTQTHSLPPPEPYLLTDTFPVEELPVVSLSFNRTEASAGDTVEVTFTLTIPNPDIFPPSNPPAAIAFAIEFDPTFIDEETIEFVPAPDAEDLMFIGASLNNVDAGRAPPSGRLEFAAGGRGQGALAMTRPIGKLIIIIEDMILLEGDPGFNILDPILINLAEQVIEVQTETDGLLVTNLNDFERSSEFDVFPNPFKDHVQICTNEGEIEKARLFNSQGQLIPIAIQQQNTCWYADLSSFPAGIYFLQIESRSVSEMIRLIKTD